jgi:hypothetical protein
MNIIIIIIIVVVVIVACLSSSCDLLVGLAEPWVSGEVAKGGACGG